MGKLFADKEARTSLQNGLFRSQWLYDAVYEGVTQLLAEQTPEQIRKIMHYSAAAAGDEAGGDDP